MAYWLIKSEPYEYSYDQLVEDGSTPWDGIRNYMARNNLRAMKKGDQLLFYHSNKGLEIVGTAKVSKTAYPDPTVDPKAKQQDWSAVDVVPGKRLKRPISLKEVKADPVLSKSGLVKYSRLSVAAFTKEEFDRVIALSKQPAP